MPPTPRLLSVFAASNPPSSAASLPEDELLLPPVGLEPGCELVLELVDVSPLDKDAELDVPPPVVPTLLDPADSPGEALVVPFEEQPPIDVAIHT
jgi:hypothetical protein